MLTIGSFINNDSVLCDKIGCRNNNHIFELERMFDKLVTPVINSSLCFSRQRRKLENYRVIPGWNRRVKSFHKDAREKFLKWIEEGRPREGTQFFLMEESRAIFKRELNLCIANQREEIDKSIEEKYMSKNFPEFWKDVKRKRIKAKKSNIIDGKNDNNDIIGIFTRKFLIDSQVNEDYKDVESTLINNIKSKWENARKFRVCISGNTVRKYCKSLKMGMGHDGIHSIFLKNSSDKYLNCVAQFMTACFSHCFIPPIVLKGDMNPTIKDLKGNVTNSSNYRPVMQSSCFLKLFEIHILSILEEKIHFNCRQFGFKKGSSTSEDFLLLKPCFDIQKTRIELM